MEEAREGSEVITVKEAAVLINYTEQRVTQLLREGKLLGQRVSGGAKWLVPRNEIDRLLGTSDVNDCESQTVMALPRALLNEVRRLLKAVRLDPKSSLEPEESLTRKFYDTLKAHRQSDHLSELLDVHAEVVTEYREIRRGVLKQLNRKLQSMSPVVEIQPWDHQVMQTLEERVWSPKARGAVEELRAYRPEPGKAKGEASLPEWGGLYFTRLPIPDRQYEAIHQLHLEFRKVAEQFLPTLGDGARPLKGISTQLIDELENIIVLQQSRESPIR